MCSSAPHEGKDIYPQEERLVPCTPRGNFELAPRDQRTNTRSVGETQEAHDLLGGHQVLGTDPRLQWEPASRDGSMRMLMGRRTAHRSISAFRMSGVESPSAGNRPGLAKRSALVSHSSTPPNHGLDGPKPLGRNGAERVASLYPPDRANSIPPWVKVRAQR